MFGTIAATLAQIPLTVGFYEASVFAVAARTTPFRIYNITFEFQPADTSNTSNGPRGEDCVGGTDQRVDEVEFDGRCDQYFSIALLCFRLLTVFVTEYYLRINALAHFHTLRTAWFISTL